MKISAYKAKLWKKNRQHTYLIKNSHTEYIKISYKSIIKRKLHFLKMDKRLKQILYRRCISGQ